MKTGSKSLQNLAIYVHVPFCGQRCAYCHFDIKVFHPQTAPEPFMREYSACLALELQNRAAHLADRTVESIYFGGGTPSRLDIKNIASILDSIQESFRMHSDCETSIEVNPEDANPGYLKDLRDLGITRLSVGVQSFHDPCLQAVRRPHDRVTAVNAIRNAPCFPHGISLDLILGLPYQTERTLMFDLEILADLDPEHVSLYMLDRDLPTPLDKTARFLEMPEEDEHAAFYETASSFLSGRGYQHYEISNFAKPGYPCRHNLVYWRCGDYLGLGPAAHGRIGREYTANQPKLSDYLAEVRARGSGTGHTETWPVERMRQERIVQGLRLAEGVPIAWLASHERTEAFSGFRQSLVERSGDRICLTRRGRLFANEIFQLFV